MGNKFLSLALALALCLTLAPAALAEEPAADVYAAAPENHEAAETGCLEQEGGEAGEEAPIAEPPVEEAPEEPSPWAAEEVRAAIEAGLVPESLRKGYRREITRGAVANIIINLIEQASGVPVAELMAEKGLEISPGAFTDTEDSAVLAANALGILNGMGEGRFEPEGTLLRAQIAGIVCRVANLLGVDTGGYSHTFSDLAGHWVEAEIGWPVHMKIIRGMSPTEFNPDGKLTAEQAIAIAYRALAALTGRVSPEPEKISVNSPEVAGKAIPILMYHAIAEVPKTEFKELFVTPAEMEAHIKYLVENGYQTITFEDLDNIGAFSKPVMITFDDGYECNYDILFPLLKKYNAKATIFVVAGSVWSKGRLSEAQIKEMSDSGLVSIQSHTVSHPYLTALSEEKLRYELAESKARIEKLTGKPVIALAYPDGDNDARIRSVAAEYYDYAALSRGGMFYCGDDTMRMKRFYIWRGMTAGQLAWLID